MPRPPSRWSAVLRAYPDHRRSPWLYYQQAAIDIAVAQRQAAVLAATPSDEQLRLAVLATLIERSRDLQELQDKVAQSIAAAFEQRDRSPWIDELMALRNAIAVKRVEVLLRRGELFPAGSDDALAAAAEAQQAAVAALGLVRDEAARRADLLRMRCAALLRMGQAEQAAELLRPLLDASTDDTGQSDHLADQPTLDDGTLALAVRLALELGQLQQAEALLASHYGDRPADAAAAPESDLARLRFLIAAAQAETADAQQQKQQVGDWMEAVRRRGGDFAQRRAETIVIERLGRSSGQLTDPRIVIAKAASALRAGNALQAAEMLATAARQASEPAAARQLGIAGAATYSSAGDGFAAAKLLLDVAVAHEQPGSAELHLQAAMLLDRHVRAEPEDASAVSANANQVDKLLRQTMHRWPGEPAAEQAHRWLVARLVAAGQRTEAAIVASPKDDPAAQDEQWESAAALWTEALAEVPLLTADWTINPTTEQLTLQALEHFPADVPAAKRCRRRLIALFGSARLAGALVQSNNSEPFIDWLLAVRRGRQSGPPPLQDVSPTVHQAAVQRLVADGIDASQQRLPLAAAILKLENDAATVPRAVALLWTEKWQQADAVLDRWLKDSSGQPGHAAAITAAGILSRSPQPDAKRRALERFAAAAAQLPQGSEGWHQAKLATLELLGELDQSQEAARLARYILLTRPPEDPAIQAHYRRWSEP